MKMFVFKLFAKRCKVCKRPAHRNITDDYLCWRHFNHGYKGYSIPIQPWAWQIDPPPKEK